jgi:hypothetical protein
MLEIVKGKRHGLLECGSSIFKTKGHLAICECTPRTNECHFVLVFGFDLDLIVSRKIIHERKGFATSTFINDLVDELCWKIIFGTCLVQITEIGTYTNSALFFIDRHRVGHPLSQMDRINKTCL